MWSQGWRTCVGATSTYAKASSTSPPQDPAGVRQVVLDPELVELLREHKDAARWTEPDHFVFAGRIRDQPRERNSARTKILYPAIDKANELLAAEDRPPLPEGMNSLCPQRPCF